VLMGKHQLWLILGFRFLYGLRSVTPFLIGTSKIAPFGFFIMNMVGASVWAVIIGTMGYLFGQSLEIILGEIKKYELILFAIIAGVGITVWSIYLLSRERK
jgi:membrane protein DedA with SNARE-associated domain